MSRPLQRCPDCGQTYLSREPWWHLPPAPNQAESECRWGFLYTCPNAHTEWVADEVPSAEEIASRKGCRLYVGCH